MEINLATLLSSTVLVGIITALVTIVNNKEKVRVENITQERKIWRNNLRELVNQIQTAIEKQDLKNVISTLKVNINAYGIREPEDYLKDGHIWEIFSQIDGCNDNRIISKKEQLVEYLSCLLKYDWERSKKEIKGNYYIAAITFIFIIGTMILCYIRLQLKDDSFIGTFEIITFNIISYMMYILVAWSEKPLEKVIRPKIWRYIWHYFLILFFPAIIIAGVVWVAKFNYLDELLLRAYLCILVIAIGPIILDDFEKVKGVKTYTKNIDYIKDKHRDSEME